MSTKSILSFKPSTLTQRLPWRMPPRTALGIILIIAVFALVGWLYLSQASALTTTSYQIEERKALLEKIKQQNVELELQIAQMEALPRIEARAKEAGFNIPTEVRFLYLKTPPLSQDQIKAAEIAGKTSSIEKTINSILQAVGIFKGEASSIDGE
jgi:hypothetical protein